MNKVASTIIGIIFAGTVIVAFSPDSEEKTSAPQCPKGQYVGQNDGKCHEFGSVAFNKPTYNKDMQFACMWYRDSVNQYGVRTWTENQKAVKKVYIGTSVTNIADAGRDFYEGFLSDNGTKFYNAGVVIGTECQKVPDPF
jgi:hypothetical protein